MSATPDSTLSNPEQRIADLERQLAKYKAERDEALAQQSATAEVLRVISTSPADLQPTLDAIAAHATVLTGATNGSVSRFDGSLIHPVAYYGWTGEEIEAVQRDYPRPPGTESTTGRAILTGDVVHVPDTSIDREYGLESVLQTIRMRTGLSVPILQDGNPVGAITVARREVAPFSQAQIDLLKIFADQAVIAIENARLIAETREALEQQTATAEVLGVINSSPGDLKPVFDAILEKAHTLCNASSGGLVLIEDNGYRPIAIHGGAAFRDYWLSQGWLPFSTEEGPVWLKRGEVLHLPDAASYPWHERTRRLVELGGARSFLMVPLLKDGVLFGAITAFRQETQPFTDKQIALLQNFAAQAVIAMENTRLLTETREALEQQTATAEVLQVINSSPSDLAPVFDTMLEKAMALCGAAFGIMATYDGTNLRPVAMRGIPPRFAAFAANPANQPGPGGATPRLAAGAPFVHVADLKEEEAYWTGDPYRRALVDVGEARSLLAVPLRKDGVMIGQIGIYRQEVRPYTDRQIALLQNFAAQAVIAMENARLITATREALDQQTATAEVLGVINSSPGNLGPVFTALLQKAHALCNTSFGALMVYDGDQFRPVASQGVPEPFRDLIGRGIRPKLDDPFGHMVDGAPLSHIHDLAEVAAEHPGAPLPRAAVDLGGIRTFLIVPLRKDNALLGVITAYRQEVRPFTDKQIALLQSFAAQAVIAMENARLLTETREARDDAESALRDLKAAQANLIQAEKMASLGQLTAGIAHEIKNPLNFVNNFASLSNELLGELREEAEPALASFDANKRAVIDETMEMLSGNLEKIAEHGQRADNIVKSMLEHSRGVSGERREVDLNGVIEEALSLAYHGARARDQSFNITLERDYAEGLKPIDLSPQEIARVFLNLFGNGFYAAAKRALNGGDGSFRPVLRVQTRDEGDAIEIRVRDNGTGIPSEIKDKLFQPFFTTKPTGEGTGLGLSISYDIVTQQHGGTITVESESGSFTEFTVRLPRH